MADLTQEGWLRMLADDEAQEADIAAATTMRVPPDKHIRQISAPDAPDPGCKRQRQWWMNDPRFTDPAPLDHQASQVSRPGKAEAGPWGRVDTAAAEWDSLWANSRPSVGDSLNATAGRCSGHGSRWSRTHDGPSVGISQNATAGGSSEQASEQCASHGRPSAGTSQNATAGGSSEAALEQVRSHSRQSVGISQNATAGASSGCASELASAASVAEPDGLWGSPVRLGFPWSPELWNHMGHQQTIAGQVDDGNSISDLPQPSHLINRTDTSEEHVGGWSRTCEAVSHAHVSEHGHSLLVHSDSLQQLVEACLTDDLRDSAAAPSSAALPDPSTIFCLNNAQPGNHCLGQIQAFAAQPELSQPGTNLVAPWPAAQAWGPSPQSQFDMQKDTLSGAANLHPAVQQLRQQASTTLEPSSDALLQQLLQLGPAGAALSASDGIDLPGASIIQEAPSCGSPEAMPLMQQGLSQSTQHAGNAASPEPPPDVLQQLLTSFPSLQSTLQHAPTCPAGQISADLDADICMSDNEQMHRALQPPRELRSMPIPPRASLAGLPKAAGAASSGVGKRDGPAGGGLLLDRLQLQPIPEAHAPQQQDQPHTTSPSSETLGPHFLQPPLISFPSLPPVPEALAPLSQGSPAQQMPDVAGRDPSGDLLQQLLTSFPSLREALQPALAASHTPHGLATGACKQVEPSQVLQCSESSHAPRLPETAAGQTPAESAQASSQPMGSDAGRPMHDSQSSTPEPVSAHGESSAHLKAAVLEQRGESTYSQDMPGCLGNIAMEANDLPAARRQVQGRPRGGLPTSSSEDRDQEEGRKGPMKPKRTQSQAAQLGVDQPGSFQQLLQQLGRLVDGFQQPDAAEHAPSSPATAAVAASVSATTAAEAAVDDARLRSPRGNVSSDGLTAVAHGPPMAEAALPTAATQTANPPGHAEGEGLTVASGKQDEASTASPATSHTAASPSVKIFSPPLVAPFSVLASPWLTSEPPPPPPPHTMQAGLILQSCFKQAGHHPRIQPLLIWAQEHGLKPYNDEQESGPAPSPSPIDLSCKTAQEVGSFTCTFLSDGICMYTFSMNCST